MCNFQLLFFNSYQESGEIIKWELKTNAKKPSVTVFVCLLHCRARGGHGVMLPRGKWWESQISDTFRKEVTYTAHLSLKLGKKLELLEWQYYTVYIAVCQISAWVSFFVKNMGILAYFR